MPRLPEHARIRQHLESQIRGGTLEPGAAVPSEADLCAEFGVSRTTVRRALGDLVTAGLVTRRPRIGTRVAQTTAEANLMRWTDLRATGAEVHGPHRVLDARITTAAEAPERIDGLADSEAVTCLRRAKLTDDDRAVALETSVIPASVAPNVLDEDLVAFTSLAYFNRIRLRIHRTRLYLDAAAADQTAADVLGLPVGSPVLRTRRLTYLDSGAIAEVYSADMPPGSLRLYVEQTAPGGHA